MSASLRDMASAAEQSVRRPSWQSSVQSVIRLALGRLPDERGGPVDWPVVFRIACHERCAVLAWTRCAEGIRTLAPAPIVSAWRAAAADAHRDALRQHRILRQVLDALAAKAVQPVILKGLPLAQRLYRDFTARMCSDLDLFVPAPERSVAATVLVAMGWRLTAGQAPFEQEFGSVIDGLPMQLDLHSSLLGAHLGHLPTPSPGQQLVQLDDLAAPAHGDHFLPAYLAAHMAKHAIGPLIWTLDLGTLWTELSDGERSVALQAAKSARLQGYLRWGLRQFDLLIAASRGSRWALLQLGCGANGRWGIHSAVRDVRLASNPADAWRSTVSWISPPPIRAQGGAMRSRWSARFRPPLSRHLIKRMPYVAASR